MASIGTYLSQPGPIVTVPAGTYTGAVGIFNLSSTPLVLVAEGADGTNYPCKIRAISSSERFDLRAGSGPIILVGFDLEGHFRIGANDFTTWYCRESYPIPNLSAFLNDTTSWTSPDPTFYDEPMCVNWNNTNAARGRKLGAEMFNQSNPFALQSCDNFYGAGGYVHDLYPSDSGGAPGTPTGDRWHSNCVQDVNGKSTSGIFDDMTLAPKRGGGTSGTGGSFSSQGCNLFAKLNAGDVHFGFNNVWVVGVQNYGFQISATSTGSCTLDLNTAASVEYPTSRATAFVYVWGGKNGTGSEWGVKNFGGAVENIARLVTAAPSSVNIGVNDPATQWKQKHPFASWQSYLGIGPASPPGPPRNTRAIAGDALVTVRCDPPVSNGGAAISTYRARILDAGTEVARKVMDITARSASFTAANGVANGTAYTPEARAENSAGASDWATGLAVTPASLAAPEWTTSDGKPLVTLSPTAGTVGVFLRLPDVGAPFTRIFVETTPDTGEHDFPVDSQGGVLPGLDSGTSYTLTATFENSAGSATSAASDAFTPAGFTQGTWKDSLGDTEGTLEAHPVTATNTAVPPAPTTRASTQDEVLAAVEADICSECRYDLGIETFRSNNASFDAVLDRIEAAGLNLNIIVNHFTNDTLPAASAEATYRSAFNALVTRVLSRYGGLVRKYEFINEPTAHAGYRDPVGYMRCFRWFAEEARDADADCIIGTGAPVHTYTNKPPAVAGSNFYNMAYDSGLARGWCETDWIADICDPAIVGANDLLSVITDVDGTDHSKFRVMMHPYSSERGTRSAFDTGNRVGVNVLERGTVVNGFREMPHVDAILTSRGIDCLIDITEFGFPTAPSYVSGRTYPKGTVLFPNEGTQNGPDLWSRPTLYVAIAATNTRPPTADWLTFSFSFWVPGSYNANRLVLHSDEHLYRALRTTTGTPGSSADWDDLGLCYNSGESPGIISTETQAAFLYENALKEWFGLIPSIDGFPVTVAQRRYGTMDIFTLYDWPTGFGFRYGARYADGTKKGLPIATGPWEKLKSLATNTDTRRGEIVIPPVLGTGCEPLLGVIDIVGV